MAMTGTFIKELEDDAGIVIGGAVFGNQHRNFAERILPAERVGKVGGIGRLDPRLAIKSQNRDCNPHLPPERRRRR